MGLFGLGLPELAIVAGVSVLLFGEAVHLATCESNVDGGAGSACSGYQ